MDLMGLSLYITTFSASPENFSVDLTLFPLRISSSNRISVRRTASGDEEGVAAAGGDETSATPEDDECVAGDETTAAAEDDECVAGDEASAAAVGVEGSG